MEYEFDNLKISVNSRGFVKTGGGVWHAGSQNPKNKYLQTTSKVTGRCYLVHRLVGHAFVPNGSQRVFTQIDHIDRSKHNNNEHNLRWISRTLNALNRESKNIAWRDRYSLWQVKVGYNKFEYNLGRWEDKNAALEVARDFKEVIFHMGYLEPIVNDLSFWENSHRSYLHGAKSTFTSAVERIGARARGHSRLRTTLVLLHNSFRSGPRVLPEFSNVTLNNE